MIRCSKCRQLKPKSEFYRNQGYCKKCAREYQKKWRQGSHSPKSKLSGTYYERNREKILQKQREHYRNLPEKEKKQYREKVKIWRENHPNYQRIRYRKTHPPKVKCPPEIVRERLLAYYAHWYQTHPSETATKRILAKAVKSGAIIKPLNCQICGRNHTRIYGHHSDYSNPLDVIWLCGSCHGLIHSGRISYPLTNAKSTHP